ncbi:hypothetical protein BDF14DRAFT_1750636 [Spinellus fusiger]|nr:hypothetical protein BDF14DRAFT_1750636 [Spinellus fusiger]
MKPTPTECITHEYQIMPPQFISGCQEQAEANAKLQYLHDLSPILTKKGITDIYPSHQYHYEQFREVSQAHFASQISMHQQTIDFYYPVENPIHFYNECTYENQEIKTCCMDLLPEVSPNEIIAPYYDIQSTTPKTLSTNNIDYVDDYVKSEQDFYSTRFSRNLLSHDEDTFTPEMSQPSVDTSYQNKFSDAISLFSHTFDKFESVECYCHRPFCGYNELRYDSKDFYKGEIESFGTKQNHSMRLNFTDSVETKNDSQDSSLVYIHKKDSTNVETVEKCLKPKTDEIFSFITQKTQAGQQKSARVFPKNRTATSYDKETTNYLKSIFYTVYIKDKRLTKQQRQDIHQKTGLSLRNITYWFSNHKRRHSKAIELFNEATKITNGKISNFKEFLLWQREQKLVPHNTPF